MAERTGVQFLTDEQLLAEIKRQWYDFGLHEWEIEQEGGEGMSLHDEYLLSDWGEEINRLECEYLSRGLVLPDRWQYVSQFR